jgi:hypothetical protein
MIACVLVMGVSLIKLAGLGHICDLCAQSLVTYPKSMADGLSALDN